MRDGRSITRWRDLTALLSDQPLATFVLLIGYVGPFLSFTSQVMNQGFELAGPGGAGKSTIQRLAAAVSGPADHPSGVNYWITANATRNGLETVMAQHNDMALIIDESNLFAAGEYSAKRAEQFNALVFSLSDGTAKRRFTSSEPQRSRFIFLTSTNEPLAQVLSGLRVAVAEAAADRLLTLPIDGTRDPTGFLTACLRDGPNMRAFADHLNQGIRQCYGVGLRRVLRSLTIEAASDPEAIARELRASMESLQA